MSTNADGPRLKQIKNHYPTTGGQYEVTLT